ncbi:MAG: VOC family protein [Planctomycetaceae bacterium]|nr:VOC family protein [Planctomycetaceae bacterium]
MPEQTPIRVRFIDHVTIVVKDLGRSRQFYVDVLGMEEVPRPGFGFAGAWFQAGPSQIHLIEEHAASGPAGLGRATGGSISRGHHFAFEVADALAAAETLKSRGLELAAGPKHRPDGPTQIYVHDPDGHLVELFSRQMNA